MRADDDKKKKKVAEHRITNVRLTIGSFVRMAVKVPSTIVLVLLLAVACGGRPPSAERVSFRTDDGFELEGRLFGEGPKGVVLGHMFPSDQSSWYEFADELSRNGYLVLTFNFRGYGNSQGGKQINLIDRDVEAAINYMQQRGAREVVLMGASMGGTASLIAASKKDVAGVVTLSAPVEFRGLDASGAVAAISAPKLFLASLNDPTGAANSADTLLRADPSADLELVAGEAHGTDMLKGRRGESVRVILREFLAEVTG